MKGHGLNLWSKAYLKRGRESQNGKHKTENMVLNLQGQITLTNFSNGISTLILAGAHHGLLILDFAIKDEKNVVI